MDVEVEHVLEFSRTLLAYSAARRVASSAAACPWFMIFCAVALPPRLAAEWCGHVDAAAALAGCSRVHCEDGALVVS